MQVESYLTWYLPLRITGLAECLRSEFQLYGLSIHAYFPGTILSPGYIEENKTKPDITKKIEGGESDGLTPEQCARGLLKGERAYNEVW
jgi:3-dehydrosphinganine reductase